MTLIEFNSKQGFHYNSCVYHEGRFSSRLFSYGWQPVCIIPPSIQHDPEFESMLDELEGEHADYETVFNRVTFWVMKKLEELELER